MNAGAPTDRDISLRLLSPDDSLEELTDLLHRAYAPLAEMGLKFVATWQDASITRKRVARGECWVMTDAGKLVGTITLTPPAATKGSPWYDRADVAGFQQLAVDPEWQGRGLGRRLVRKAEERAWAIGARHLACDTSEHAHHLIRLYEREGYRIVEPVKWEAVNYESRVMSKPIRPRIKICCIADRDEARMALAAGADALGLVSAMPSGPGPIDEGTIAEVAADVPAWAETFLLTSRRSAAEIAAQVVRCRPTTVQLVDRVEPGARAALRREFPSLRIVQVIHVDGMESVADALDGALDSDALLLDSGRPGAAVPELGGTGRRHDWSVSRAIVEASPIPVWLAGGLNAGNVAEAVATVDPAGIDLCSGVRTTGRLDPDKLAAYMAAARG